MAYPTDSGLLAKAIGRIAATQRQIQAAGGATRTKVRDRSRSAGKRAHAIGAKLRMRSAAGKDEAQAAVRRVTGELADLAQTVAKDAERVLGNAKRALRRARIQANQLLQANGERDAAAGRRRGQLARAVDDLDQLVAATRQIAAQTRQRLAGITPSPGQLGRVSLHDPDARPIAEGRLGKPIEFGHKAQLVDNEDGVVWDYTVEQGNPADAPQLAPAVERITRRTGRPPRAVTADRGYGEQKVDDTLHDAGVRYVVIPPQGQTRQGQTGRGTPTSVPPNHEMADRDRRQDQHPQTRLRMGPEPASTAPKEPGSGPDTESWPTTWSRSPPWQADLAPRNRRRPQRNRVAKGTQPAPAFFRSK